MPPSNLSAKESREYEKWGATPPTSQSHGTDKEISQNMVKLWPRSWQLVGNKLIGKTDMGEIAQYIPTNYILTGTDVDGQPVFRKIDG